MPDWVDIVVPLLILITALWGLATGYWQALIVFLALVIGVAVGARFDVRATDAVARFVTSPTPQLLQAIVFIVITIVVTAIASGVLGWILGFARPTTRAARALPSTRLFGALFGLAFGILLVTVLAMSAYLGTGGTLDQTVPSAARVRTVMDQAQLTPQLWRVTHLTDRALARVTGPTPPPFDVP